MITPSGLLQLNHAAMRTYCIDGDTVLDATMGNGHETVFLAQVVGASGVVIAVDKQAEALKKTAELLDVMDLTSRVKLIQGDHKNMADILFEVLPSKNTAKGLAAAVFNLGYLPGGDKSVTTDAKSTILAMDAVWPSIRPGGVLSVHVYTGHPGGEEEGEQIAVWMKSLYWRDAQVAACHQHNKLENQETLYLAVKNPS